MVSLAGREFLDGGIDVLDVVMLTFEKQALVDPISMTCFRVGGVVLTGSR